MRISNLVFGLLALMLAVSWSTGAVAQVGRCFAPQVGASWALYPNGLVVQDQNPANQGMAVRDISGQTFLRLPSTTPQTTAYFLTWNGALVEVHYQYGMRQVGYCQVHPAYIPPNPWVSVWQPPQYQQNYAVEVPGGQVQVPTALADPSQPFAPPLLTSEAKAQQCYQQSWTQQGGLNRERFGACMVQTMIGSREQAVLRCAQQSSDAAARSFCMVGVLGGENEQRIAQTLQSCYSQYGADYGRYPLCMGSAVAGGDAAKLLACVQQQQTSVTVMGTAVCYGSQTLDMNPEMQIITSCAVTTGGEPYAFAGCAGGQLTTRELDKCLQYGVGGSNGCFGPNNTIVQALNAGGQVLAQQFGPNNDLVQTWNTTMNDIQYGPGPNHEVVRTFSNVTNEVNRGATNIAREVGKALPRIKISW